MNALLLTLALLGQGPPRSFAEALYDTRPKAAPAPSPAAEPSDYISEHARKAGVGEREAPPQPAPALERGPHEPAQVTAPSSAATPARDVVRPSAPAVPPAKATPALVPKAVASTLYAAVCPPGCSPGTTACGCRGGEACVCTPGARTGRLPMRGPTVWSLADSTGKVWTHQDKAYLIKYVASVNAKATKATAPPPRASVPPAAQATAPGGAARGPVTYLRPMFAPLGQFCFGSA